MGPGRLRRGEVGWFPGTCWLQYKGWALPRRGKPRLYDGLE